MKIGFDLDRVLVNYPPIVPAGLIDWLYKNHNNGLSYRIPTNQIEIWIRKLMHLPFLRRPILKNVDFVNKLVLTRKHKLYLISSRYSFLKKITGDLLIRIGLGQTFAHVFINLHDEQAHLFKERIIKKEGIEMYVDDDKELLEHIKKTCTGVTTIHYLPGDDLEKCF